MACRGFSPPKLNVSPLPQTELAIFDIPCESAQKFIVSHKIPQKFNVSGAQAPP